MSDFARKLKVRSLGVSSVRFSPDDYEFTIGGQTYYMDANCRHDKSFLTIALLDELEVANKKIALLEAEIGRQAVQKLYRRLN